MTLGTGVAGALLAPAVIVTPTNPSQVLFPENPEVLDSKLQFLERWCKGNTYRPLGSLAELERHFRYGEIGIR